MNLHIMVCLKQVPASNNVKIDPKTKNLMRSGEPGIINPYDQNALEAALILKEQTGAKITLLSMGPPNFDLTLRQGLAMGADDALLLTSRAFGGADTLATAYALATVIKNLPSINLVLFGQQSMDADTGQVGPLVGQFLDWPQATYSQELALTNEDKIRSVRYTENTAQTIELSLPSVISVSKKLNHPRYPSLVNIQKSYAKEIVIYDEKTFPFEPNRIGLKGSPTMVRKIYSPIKGEKVSISLGDNALEAALKTVEILKERNLLLGGK